MSHEFRVTLGVLLFLSADYYERELRSLVLDAMNSFRVPPKREVVSSLPEKTRLFENHVSMQIEVRRGDISNNNMES